MPIGIRPITVANTSRATPGVRRIRVYKLTLPKLRGGGTGRSRDPRGRVPGGEAADDAGPVSADAELAAAGVQPVDQPRPRGGLRRGDGPVGARPARTAQVDDAGELVDGALGQVQAPAGPGARAQRSAAGAAVRAHAARSADGGPAAPAQRAHLPLRLRRRGRPYARRAGGAGACGGAATAAGRARPAL